MRFRIDLKIFIFIILFWLTKQIEVYAYVMIFAFIHELGHLVTGLIVGMKPEKIEIMPFGVSISFKINPKEYNIKIKKANKLEIKKIIVALAGPLTNFLIILIAGNLKIDIFKSLIIIYTNFLIMIFNLLPIYPLDDGRVLNGILYIIFGKRKAEKYTNIISKIAVSAVTIISSIAVLYIHNIAIILIDIYLWYLIIKEDTKYNKRQEIYKKLLENNTI